MDARTALDPQLEAMAQIAQPLDEWCDFCTTKLAIGKTADGVNACSECMKAVIEAMQQYANEAVEATEARRALRRSKPGAGRALKRRRAKNKVAKASRKRNRR